MERKSFKVAALDSEGTGVARIATMNTIDLDGDVVLPGALGRQEAVLLPSHDWSSVPLGRASVREEGNSVVADLAMNLEIPAARDLHSALKFDLRHGKPLQQWSWGFGIKAGGSRRGEFNGRQVRFLTPLPNGEPGVELFEVSSVLKGASVATQTLSMKRATADTTPPDVLRIYAKFALADERRKFANSLALTEWLKFRASIVRARGDLR